jgi:maltose alpha-D-glucosyltransferase/alpha-amylase
MLREWVPNQGQAWEMMLDVVSRYFEESQGEAHRLDKLDLNLPPVFALSDRPVPSDVHEVIGSALLTAGVLGRRTAEMHLALASQPDEPAFSPEPLLESDLMSLSERLKKEVRQTLATLQEQFESLPEDVRGLGEEVLKSRSMILEIVARQPEPDERMVKIRIHGDYQLGQLLWRENDFMILDFEGEIGRSYEERRAKRSPLKDVAGMLRSFDYAADIALSNFAKIHPDALEKLKPWSIIWRSWMSAEFLKAYRSVASSLVPVDAGSAERLLDWLRLEKALGELRYELNYRPDWVRIPLLGIMHLIRSGE